MRDFKLPELGENIRSGDVVSVLVKPGDRVAEGQTVLEVETDKAALEVPSKVSGTVADVRVKPGEKVTPGQVLFTVEEASAPAAEAVSQPVPPAVVSPKYESVSVSVAPSSIPAAPSVRRLARELGVALADAKGSGPGGRVLEEDVRALARQGAPAPVAPGASFAPGAAAQTSEIGRSGTSRTCESPKFGTGSGTVPAALPDFSKWGPVERVAMTSVRRATAAHVAESWVRVPHVTQYDKTDITEFEELRREYARRFEEAGGRLTVTVLALKVCAAALARFPQFNSSLDEEGGEIVRKGYRHIGVAVDTDRGLLVPVIRDADKKSLLELAVELARASERARSRRLAPEEMQGGCFTITNLGGLGGTAFSPIVNWPEAAILGISRAALEPVVTGGVCAPRLMLPLSLSYDHRLIDGADGARFLRWVAEAFQRPLMLSLE